MKNGKAMDAAKGMGERGGTAGRQGMGSWLGHQEEEFGYSSKLEIV